MGYGQCRSYFEPGVMDPFLNQKNSLLHERLRLHFTEGWAHNDPPEDYESMEFERAVELGQVGVGDGD